MPVSRETGKNLDMYLSEYYCFYALFRNILENILGGVGFQTAVHHIWCCDLIQPILRYLIMSPLPEAMHMVVTLPQ